MIEAIIINAIKPVLLRVIRIMHWVLSIWQKGVESGWWRFTVYMATSSVGYYFIYLVSYKLIEGLAFHKLPDSAVWLLLPLVLVIGILTYFIARLANWAAKPGIDRYIAEGMKKAEQEALDELGPKLTAQVTKLLREREANIQPLKRGTTSKN